MSTRTPTSAISSTRRCRSSPASRTPTPSSPSRRSAQARSRLVAVLRGLPGRRWRSVHWRQRLEILRHASAIFSWQLRDVFDHARHRAAGAVAVGHFPGFEEIGDVLLAPFGESFLGDVGYPALTFRIRSAREALRGDDTAKEISGAVTLCAMAENVDGVRTANTANRVRRNRRERPAVHEQQFPDSDIAPDIERKQHGMIAHLAGHGGKRFQVGKEVADVFNFRMLVRRIGKRRKVMKSGWRDSFGHRTDEFGLGPSTDPVGRIRRDVWGVEDPEW